MRRAPREEGARWLQQAVEDLRWADDLAERERDCFTCGSQRHSVSDCHTPAGRSQ
jgi:hypothetical protein